MGSCMAIGFALYGPNLGFLFAEGRRDSTDFSKLAGREDDTFGTALCNGGAAVGYIKPITRSSVVGEG